MNLQTSYYDEDREENISRKIFIFLAGVFCAVFIFFFVVDVAMLQKYRFILISGSSMANTLNPNAPYGSGQDGVYILLTQDVTYGDIIVREKPDGTSIIKRVMAMEGDKVCVARVKLSDDTEQVRFMRIKTGTDTIEILQEDYIKSYEEWDKFEIPAGWSEVDGVFYGRDFYNKNLKDKDTVTITYQEKDYKFMQIPEGKIFYMGDNRAGSDDSRKEGAQPANEVVGKVVRISRDIFSFQNSPFYLFNYAGGYLGLIWDEIVAFFSF